MVFTHLVQRKVRVVQSACQYRNECFCLACQKRVHVGNNAMLFCLTLCVGISKLAESGISWHCNPDLAPEKRTA